MELELKLTSEESDIKYKERGEDEGNVTSHDSRHQEHTCFVLSSHPQWIASVCKSVGS